MVAILIATMVLRALVPAGYMLSPATGDSGPFALTICSAYAGGKSHSQAPSDPSRSAPDYQPCGFAISHGGLVPTAIAAIVTPPIADAPVQVSESFGLPPAPAGPQLGARAPPARG